VFVAGEQIDIPCDRNAEPWIYRRAVAIIGQEQDIQFNPTAAGHELVEGSVVLNRVEIDDAKPDPTALTRLVVVGDLDGRVHVPSLWQRASAGGVHDRRQ
jgi:hypothetical protein